MSDEVPAAGAGAPAASPDPEVVAKPTRRQFTAAYRLRILEEADRCTHSGELGSESSLAEMPGDPRRLVYNRVGKLQNIGIEVRMI